METFRITVNNKQFEVRSHEEKDQIMYEIYTDDKLQCTIGLNEYGEWEADCNYDPATVKQIGDAIEDAEDSESEFDVEGDPHPDDLDIP
jgi:hypothetical protein